MGQNIKLDNLNLPTGSQYLDLLVGSSCGSTNPSDNDPNIQVSVTLLDQDTQQATSSTKLLPEVPDMLITPPTVDTSNFDVKIHKVITLPSSRIGTSTSTDKPTLYELVIPTNATSTERPVRVTLPYLRGDLSGSCNTPNLHVFAIAAHS